MRLPHYLRRPKRSRFPQYCAYLDVETVTVNHGFNDLGREVTEEVFQLGYAAFDTRRGDRWQPTRWLKFLEISDFWSWLTAHIRDNMTVVLFAHNVNFDFSVAHGWEELPKYGYHLSNFIVDDPPTMLEYIFCHYDCHELAEDERKALGCKRTHRRIRVLDTMNYFRMSLENLGRSVGSEKGQMPLTPSGDRAPYEGEYIDLWDAYNKQDVQVMIDAMRKFFDFIRDNDLGSFSITQASQSFMAYRHRFMPDETIFIDTNPLALEISRKAYYGGRTEAFRRGDPGAARYYKLDINSMYPGVMRDGIFPTKLAAVWRGVSLKEFETRLQGRYLYTAQCVIETDEPAYPIYQDNRLVFPIGRFDAYLATPEIEYAIEKGHLKYIKRIAVYDGEELFKDFVDFFYNLRLKAKEDGNEIDSFFLKILMNSLYGKFGQNGRKWQTVDTDDGTREAGTWIVHDMDTNENISYRKAGGIVQQLQKQNESMNSHPAIAAHITSQARINLWRLIVQAGRENVFYCDTDSVFVNEEGRDRLASVMDETKLGFLKVEKETTHLRIFGLKDYEFGEEIRIKGVSDPANRVSDNVFRVQQFQGLKGKLRDNDLNRQFVIKGTKVLTRNYTKGVVEEDGYISPFILTQ